jgi:hypothetical protein
VTYLSSDVNPTEVPLVSAVHSSPVFFVQGKVDTLSVSIVFMHRDNSSVKPFNPAEPSGIDILSSVWDRDRDWVKTSGSVRDRD